MTKVYKNIRGNWTAETRVEFDAATNRYIEFTTSKTFSGNITTTASVMVIKDNIKTMVLYGDYHKQLASAKFRATEKTVKEFHRENMEANWETVFEEAKAFYLAKGE